MLSNFVTKRPFIGRKLGRMRKKEQWDLPRKKSHSLLSGQRVSKTKRKRNFPIKDRKKNKGKKKKVPNQRLEENKGKKKIPDQRSEENEMKSY